LIKVLSFTTNGGAVVEYDQDQDEEEDDEEEEGTWLIHYEPRVGEGIFHSDICPRTGMELNIKRCKHCSMCDGFKSDKSKKMVKTSVLCLHGRASHKRWK
jgi:hypothetical protein